jgi:hypothetical protein
MAAIKICGWIALGLVVVVLQGLAVFWYRGYGGSFWSQTGLECAAIPAIAEIVLLVVVLRNLDELHARSMSNPHSIIGEALRRDAHRSPAPPPTRKAWDGGFEDMDDASSKMGKDR